MSKVLFIINPIAGMRKRGLSSAISLCKSDYEIVETQYPGHATELAQASDADIVVAVGGDGTVNEVATGLIGSNKALGIVPCGSGNGLARHLKLSLKVREAVEIINLGHTTVIDTGVVNEMPFFCTCGIGLDAEVGMNFANAGKRGAQTYIAETVKLLNEYSPDNYEVLIDGKLISQKAMFVTIANANQWGNNGMIAPEASLTDGLLNVTIVAPFSSIRIPGMVAGLFTGTINRMHGVYSYQGQNIRVIPEKEMVAHRDGEPMLNVEEISAYVRPASLKTIIP